MKHKPDNLWKIHQDLGQKDPGRSGTSHGPAHLLKIQTNERLLINNYILITNDQSYDKLMVNQSRLGAERSSSSGTSHGTAHPLKIRTYESLVIIYIFITNYQSYDRGVVVGGFSFIDVALLRMYLCDDAAIILYSKNSHFGNSNNISYLLANYPLCRNNFKR